MRLGAQPCKLKAGSLAAKLYGTSTVRERHRHRYEFNNKFRKQFEKAGMIFSGTSPDNKLVEMVELPGHRFYIACQFHPEFQSNPIQAHPLFEGFIAACQKKIFEKEE